MRISERFRNSLRASVKDSREGSLRMIAESLARLVTNKITGAVTETSDTGSEYVALADEPAFRISGVNTSGQSIDFRRADDEDSPVFTVADDGEFDFPCVANANEWELKRNDDDNGQVEVNYLCLFTE